MEVKGLKLTQPSEVWSSIYTGICRWDSTGIIPTAINLQRYKIWRLLLNEDSEAFVVSLLLQFV